MKPIHSTVLDLQAKIFRHRLKLGEVLTSASVSPSTWARWKGGAAPNTATLDKVSKAIDALTPTETETTHG